MKVAKWGNSLAVRLPADIVERLDLRPGVEFEAETVGPHRLELRRKMTPAEAVREMERLARPLPPGCKFDREELYERSPNDAE